MEIGFSTKDMPLDDYVALFNDDDPWAVSPREWDRRINSGAGLPRGHYALTDLELRDLMRDGTDDTSAALRRIDERVARRRQIAAGMTAPPSRARERDSLSQALARTIRFERLRNHLKMNELSRAARISPPVLSRIENGLRPVTIDELDRIAPVLRRTVSAMLELGHAERRVGDGR